MPHGFTYRLRPGLRPVTVLVAALMTTVCGGGTEPATCEVSSVVVQPPQVTLSVGAIATLTATVNSANCEAGPTVTWTTSNSSAVSLLPNGNQVQLTGAAPTSVQGPATLGRGPITVSATALGHAGSSDVTVLPAAAIALAPPSLTFSALAGGANPASQAVTITNSGAGVLNGLAVGTITYGPGASAWLQAPVLSSTTANPSATLTLQPITGTLSTGAYTATVPITSGVATNSPQNVTLTFVVGQPPSIALAPSSQTFNAIQGGPNPVSQTVTITNSGGGTLSGLGAGTVTYGAGGSGWLQAPVLNSTTANPSATLTLLPVTGALGAGTYTATIPVTSSVASNSPQNVSVTFVIGPAPLIALAPSSQTFNAIQGGSNPVSQTVTITNSGGGTLGGLGVGTVTYGAGGSGWLQAPVLNSTTANPSATLTLLPVTGALGAGTYTATVPVTSSVASNSPRNVSVTFVVAPAPMIALTLPTLTFNGTEGGGNPPSQAVAVTNSGGGTLDGLGVGTITYGAGASGWLQASLGSPSAPTTLTLQPLSGTLTPGLYSAIVPVVSAVASNSPQNASVGFAVIAPAIASVFSNVTGGGSHTCGLTTGGVAYCWGNNEVGQLGTGGPSFGAFTPQLVSGGLTFATLTAAAASTCGLTTTGTAYCWGDNVVGQVGDSTTTQRNTPVPVAGGLSFVSLSAGSLHWCGVAVGGDAYCWGWNAQGQLGDGTFSDQNVPVQVLGGLTFTALAPGYNHTCGIAAGGAAYCWGQNTYRQLGDGSTIDHITPGPVAGGQAFTTLSAAGYHACGLTAGGAAYCWGDNSAGALGDGTFTIRSSPVAVTGGLSIMSIVAGISRSCALTTAGAAYCWGLNTYGESGDGTSSNFRGVPAQVVGGLVYTSLTAAPIHSCGISATVAGAVFCWGSNGFGLLGDGTQTTRLVPTPVVSP